jgi:hypothetical protein
VHLPRFRGLTPLVRWRFAPLLAAGRLQMLSLVATVIFALSAVVLAPPGKGTQQSRYTEVRMHRRVRIESESNLRKSSADEQ